MMKKRLVPFVMLSGLASLLLAVTAAAAGFRIDPHVTRVDAESAVVIWVGPPSDNPGRVEIEPVAGGASRTVTPALTPAAFVDRSGTRDDARHLARIDGLQPFTTYRYRAFGSDGGSLREGTFKTAPEPGRSEPFRFSVISDTHSGHAAVAAAVAAEQPDFVVLTGDFIGGRGHDWGNWLSYFASGRPYLQQTPIWPVIGGHDIRPDRNYRALFGLDDPAGNFPHARASYYTFTFGNLRYISLDQYSDDRETQLEWLEQVLRENDAEWTFASFHSPVFAVGSRGGVGGHAAFVPLFERYGVDVVIYGHNHIYERMLPIGPADGKPVHYICTNAGGNFRTIRPSPIVAGGIGRRVLCHATFSIDGNRLTMVVREAEVDGREIDRLELVKTDGRYQPEIMEQAIETELARRIAHVFSAGGEPAGMYNRRDILVEFEALPQPGEPVTAMLDTRAFPAGSRLRVAPVADDNPWSVAEQTFVIAGDGQALALTGPVDLVYAKAGLSPDLRLELTLELNGRLFQPAGVVSSPGPATLAMLSPDALTEKLGLEAIGYSTDLQPAARLGLPDTPAFDGGFRSRGPHTYYTWVDAAPGAIELRVMGGGISAARYRRRGAFEFELFYPADPETGERVSTASVERTGATQSITLSARNAGAHRIVYNDGRDRTNVNWDQGLPMTVKVAPDDYPAYPSEHQSWPDMVFYVPPGTETVDGHAWAGGGEFRDGDGKRVFSFGRYEGFFQVPVPAGQDGALWQLRGFSGRFYFLNVPPYLARSAAELLLPREVVEANR